jgi:hypothetical protein
MPVAKRRKQARDPGAGPILVGTCAQECWASGSPRGGGGTRYHRGQRALVASGALRLPHSFPTARAGPFNT